MFRCLFLKHVRLFFAALAPLLAFGQAAQTSAQFEVADVHASPEARNNFRRGPLIRNGLYQLRFATLVDMISAAYGIEAAKVVGGPSWLEYDQFDVIARVPTGTNVETARPMLQALLAERFKLTFHHETRPMAAWALRASKHPQLKPAASGQDEGRCRFVPGSDSAPGRR